MATKAPTSFPSNSSARIHKTWTFRCSYIQQKSLNLSLQTTKNMMFSSEKRFLSIWRLAGFLPAYRWVQPSSLVLYWHLLISAKPQAKTRLTKRSNVSKSTNNTRQRWVSSLRWHKWNKVCIVYSCYKYMWLRPNTLPELDCKHKEYFNIRVYGELLRRLSLFWHFGVSYFLCPVAARSPRATGTEYRLGQV